MTIDKEFDYLKKMANELEIQAPESSWNKLEEKLNLSRKQKILQFRSGIRLLMSIAAVVVVLVIAIGVMQNINSNISDVNRGTIVEWEELDTHLDFFYSTEQIRELNAAYSKLSFEGASLNPMDFRDGLLQNPG